jgi:hypothetical protein
MKLNVVAGWLITNTPHSVLISVPMLENRVLMTSKWILSRG